MCQEGFERRYFRSMHGARQLRSPAGRAPYLAARLQGLGTTVFAEMSDLAARTGSINLGQGFPDYDGPPAVTDAAIAAIRGGTNQYPPGPGDPALLRAIAEHQSRFYGQDLGPGEVLVTAGATEAITAAVLALCETGDEVLAFAPVYDSYPAAAAMAGARLVTVPLRPPAWDVDLDRLAAAITPRTRILLLNTPHNPTGKVFNDAELDAVAALCRHHDLLAISDEVYEHLVFDGTHQLLAQRPGMAERTLTASSGGKTFSCTGWKVGWIVGPTPLVTAVRTAKQYMTYVNAAPFQPAIAVGLGLPDRVFADVVDRLRAARDLLCQGLAASGMQVVVPAATYFAMADVSVLGYDDGVAFCRMLPERCGVVAVPASAFYPGGGGESYVRFAFCKQPAVLEEAVSRLAALAPS